MQQLQLQIDHQKEASLLHNAFDVLVNQSNDLYFLLNDQLYIQKINEKVSEFFFIDSKEILNTHLPSWFVQNAWVPPLVHFETLNQSDSKKFFQTKISNNSEEYLIDWKCEWINSSQNLTEGLLLRGTLHAALPSVASSSIIVPAQEEISVFEAIHSHFDQLTSLANQTLQNRQEDPINLKIALQNILLSIEYTQKLLSFSNRLEKNRSAPSMDVQTVDLQKVLKSIIEKYQLEHNCFNVQIFLEIQQSQSSSKQLWDKTELSEGLSALILPLICFLNNGFFRLSVSQKDSNPKIGLTHIHCKLKGEDIFGHSIQDWFHHRADLFKLHKTLQLHWLLGKEWLESLHGLYQVQMIGSEVHIDMMLPYKSQTVLATTHPINESIPMISTDKKIKSVVSLDYQEDCDPLTKELRTPESVAILLIEDNEMNKRAVLQIIHRMYGNVYFKAVDCAEDAVKAYQQASYDLIIMDIGLPDNDGLQLAYRLRRLEFQLERKEAPICVLSAHYSQSIYEEECESIFKDTLIQGFYTKPLLPHKAQELVGNWVPKAHKRHYEVQA